MSELDSAPYRNATLDTATRVEDLIGRMELEEKVAQLGCVWSTQLVGEAGFSAERAREHMALGTGQVTRIGATTGLRPRESASFMNAIQDFLRQQTRLGIPALVHEESCAGFCARDADQFPQAIGLAASFDPESIERAAVWIRRQMLAVGARQTLAPVLDVARDPRWGRVEETFGEDPYLAGRMGVAYVRGIQGNDLHTGVAATGKHFLGYGLSEGGHNHKPVHLGARELREVFARPFLAAIQEAGLASIMNAYNEVDGLPCGGSREILDELLRGELGFEGLVVADYFTTLLLIASHRVAADKAEAARMALEAGLDAELPALDCYAELVQLVKSGAVDLSLVDRSLRRVLRLKFELGLFEASRVDAAAAAQAYQTPEVRGLARRLAARSIVLLKNDAGLLPLSPDARRIAVLGPCADDVRLLQGDYHYPAHAEITYRRGQDDLGSILPRSDRESAFKPGPWYPPTVTPLEGIRAAAPSAEVFHAPGCEILGDNASGIAAAVEQASAADVAILCVGGRSGLMPDCSVGEFRDSASLELPGVQRQLVEQVLATGTPTVVVIISGRVHALAWLAELAPTLLYAFVPGEEGGHGLADLLFGHESPSGRLPVSLPRHVGQVPIYYSRKWSAEGGGAGPFSPQYVEEQATPLFPFGHGLGYASFEYSELSISPEEPVAGQAVEASLRVANSSEVRGCEVVQLYVQDPVASVTRPISQLVGFARVELEPGEARRVGFRLDTSQLAFYDRRMRFVIEPGEILVRVGASSADLRLNGRFRITGDTREADPRRIVPTRVEIT